MVGEQEQITNDAAYLIDELKALKLVLPSIPFANRAGSDLSVLQILELVNYIQLKFIDLLNLVLSNAKLDSIDFNIDDLRIDFTNHLKSSTLEGNTDHNFILDNCISQRIRVVEKIHSLHISTNSPEMKTSILNILSSIVNSERLLFKQIAERVLTIDPQNQHGL
jgi:hypothetical protein